MSDCKHLEVKERLLAGKTVSICVQCGVVCTAPGKAAEIVLERGRKRDRGQG